MVRLEGVALRYGEYGRRRGHAPEVLRDISFAIPGGGFRWLLGQSGAGKSSLLRLLHLAVRPTRGRLGVLGVEIGSDRSVRARRRLPTLRRRIGMVFQDFPIAAAPIRV